MSEWLSDDTLMVFLSVIVDKIQTTIICQHNNLFFQKHSVYTILFLDEANTTEAIGLVKEVLCDGRIRGKPIDPGNGLKIVAACNPYRKHSVEMIKKLKEAGLGYIVGEAETQDKFGTIP